MEMNPHPLQASPANPIHSAPVPFREQADPSTGQRPDTDAAGAFPPSRKEAATAGPAPLYDPVKAGRIARSLRELFDPACVLLFGSFAGGTPHSEVLCYDLLVLTSGPVRYDGYEAKRFLKMKLPEAGHGAPYVNVYVYRFDEADSRRRPFLWLARAEGILLSCHENHPFRRPRRPLDYALAACDARRNFVTFSALGGRFLEDATEAAAKGEVRRAAFFTAQAAVLFYQALFSVYHGLCLDTEDPERLHERTRTLSGELRLLYESDSFTAVDTLSQLKRYMTRARYDPDFCVEPPKLEAHIEKVSRMREVVERACARRIALYEEWAL